MGSDFQEMSVTAAGLPLCRPDRFPPRTNTHRTAPPDHARSSRRAKTFAAPQSSRNRKFVLLQEQTNFYDSDVWIQAQLACAAHIAQTCDFPK
jgi:hypothetical protein